MSDPELQALIDAASAYQELFVPALFASADTTSATIGTHLGTGRFSSVRSMVEGDLRGWLPVMGLQLPESLIHRDLDEAQSALSAFVTAEGEVVFDSPAHIIAWTKP